LLLSVALKAGAALPGESKNAKECQWQKPGDLPCKRFIEEA
jgi:hypothetical protein